MGRPPTALDADATAAAVDAARQRMAAAWSALLILRAGRRPPRAVVAALTTTRAGRADLYRVVRAIADNAPMRRPGIIDAPNTLLRDANRKDFVQMIETLRVAHDLATTRDARVAVANYRGVVQARYFRALGNKRV